jgi:hypothetical protein
VPSILGWIEPQGASFCWQWAKNAAISGARSNTMDLRQNADRVDRILRREHAQAFGNDPDECVADLAVIVHHQNRQYPTHRAK